MLHPHSEIRFIDPIKGYGVVATKFIPKGTITWVLDPLDQIITPEQAALVTGPMRDVLEKYSYRNSDGNHVLCWDHTKYMNHSFTPNCMLTAMQFEIAVRDINVGEELTNDYGFLNLSEAFSVSPEKGSKRTAVTPEDIIQRYRTWDRKIKTSVMLIMTVEQPLQQFFNPVHWDKTEKIALGIKRMPSIMRLYFNPAKPPVHSILRIA